MSYRFSMRRWAWIDGAEHRDEIAEAIKVLDAREVDAFLLDTPGRRIDAVAHYLTIGPDHDDCDPLMHLAEALWARAGLYDEHAEYALRMAASVRSMLVCRVIRDISEVRQGERP